MIRSEEEIREAIMAARVCRASEANQGNPVLMDFLRGLISMGEYALGGPLPFPLPILRDDYMPAPPVRAAQPYPHTHTVELDHVERHYAAQLRGL